MNIKSAFLLVAAMAYLNTVASVCHAVDYTFVPGGANDWWGTAANWNPVGIPNSVNDRVIFDASTLANYSTNTHPGPPFTVREMVFNTPSNWRIHNNERDVNFDAPGVSDAYITQNGSGVVTFDADWVLTDNTVVRGTGIGEIILNGSILTGPGQRRGIIGPGSLTKNGNFTLTVNSIIQHTGGTAVDGGTMRLAQAVGFPGAGSTGQFSSPHTVTINSGGTLQLNNHWVMGDGLANQVIVNGGTLQFFNSDNYLGNIVLDEGTITTSGGIRPWRTGNFGSGLITVNNTGAGSSNISGSLAFVGNGASPFTTFNVADGAAAVDLTMSSTIFDHPGFEGQMQLVKAGAGTMVLSGNSTFSGGTRIDDGALWATSPTALGSGTVTMNGGTLRMSNNLNNNIALNNTTNTIQPSGFYHQLNGQISGPGGFILANGGGTTGLELTNPANNFGGDVTINGGATYLRLTASEVIPNTANVTNNGNLRLDVPGGGTETISGLSGSGSVWVPTSNNNLHTLVVGASNASSTFAGQFGPAGQNNAFLALQKIGSGTLTMTGGGLASAGVTVDGGTLRFQSARGFNQGFFTNVDNVPITINAGATLESASIWNMRSNNIVDINGGTLSFLADSYLNNISMDEGTITTVLAGRPWRTGNFANGVINVNNSGAGSSNISGLLTFVGTGAAPTTTFNVADGSAAIDLTVSSNISDHPGFEGQMRLIKTGAGTMALTNPSSSWDGGLSINGGVITVSQLTPGNTNGPLGGWFGTAAFLSFDGGTLQYTGGNVGGINRSFTLNAGGGTIDITNPGTTVTWTDAAGAGPIVGAGAFTKTGLGTLVISDLTGGAGQGNSYSGGTVIDNGTLVGISAGAATSPFGTGQITLNGANDTALFGRGGDTVLNNNIVITAGGGTTTIGADSGTRTIYNGTVNINKNVVFHGSATDRTTFLGVISGTGNILVNGGDRTTWQANNNTFVGDVDIQGAGTVLQIGNPGGGNEIPDSSNVNIGPGARLHLVFVDETIGGLTGDGTIAFFPSGALGASTLSIGAGGVSSTFDGVIEDGSPSAMNIAKIGSGTLTFNGDHTYTGTTDVDVGTLILNGTHTGAGDYNIASGATLGGDGEIALGAGNSVNVAATPGVISPGPGFSGTNPANPADVGTFTISGSGTVLDMDGILLIDIVSPIEHDLLKILGDADIDPGATLNINGETDFTNLDSSLMSFQLGDRIDILMADQLVNGTSFGNFPDNMVVHGPGGWPIFFGNDGSTLFLQAVPEPHSIAIWTLLGLGLAGFGYYRVRRKK